MPWRPRLDLPACAWEHEFHGSGLALFFRAPCNLPVGMPNMRKMIWLSAGRLRSAQSICFFAAQIMRAIAGGGASGTVALGTALKPTNYGCMNERGPLCAAC